MKPKQNSRIELNRTLHRGIDRSDQATYNGTVATYPVTLRGVLKAAREYAATRKSDEQRWGNVGAGDLSLILRGRDVTYEVVNAAASGSGRWIDSLLVELQTEE